MLAEKLNIRKRLDSIEPAKVKRTVVIIALVLVLAVIIRNLMPSSYSGEDEMQKEVAAETGASVEIFATEAYDNKYLAGYKTEKGCGYAEFTKDKDGKFVLGAIKQPEELEEMGEDIFVDMYDDKAVVSSGNSALSKIGIIKTVNGFLNAEEERTSVHGNPSLTIISLGDGEKITQINFYDSKGMPVR